MRSVSVIVFTPIAPRLVLRYSDDIGALAVAVLGHHEQILVVAGDVHRQDGVRARSVDVHAADAGGVAAHRAHIGLVEAHGVAVAGDHQDVVVPLVRRTATSSSSSLILIAMIPSALIGVL